jgi:hypothetical protein
MTGVRKRSLRSGSFASALQYVIDTIHAHPTLSEPIREAVLKAEGRPIHII